MDTGIKLELIDEICEIARQNNIDKVVLFGSRARGDYRERSDIDLAVIGGNYERFVADIEDKTNTLLMYDIVNMNISVQKELMESIKKEGVILYEKI